MAEPGPRGWTGHWAATVRSKASATTIQSTSQVFFWHSPATTVKTTQVRIHGIVSIFPHFLAPLDLLSGACLETAHKSSATGVLTDEVFKVKQVPRRVVHRARPRKPAYRSLLCLDHVPDAAAAGFLHGIVAIPRYQMAVLDNMLLAWSELNTLAKHVSYFSQ